MSKYEHFVNMKTHVFLIILGSIQFVFSCNHDLNFTDDLYPVCPVQLFRRKRAYPNYARWRSSEEDPGEFLVKVFDEEFTTSHKPIVAVNIIGPTKGDRLIIGAPTFPSLTTLITTGGELREYTRFVPPTTLAKRDGNIMYIPPITPITTTTARTAILQPMPQKVYYSQRDDSPPASPQFIARTPELVRQYAPIEAVAFTRRSSIGPVTPPHTFTNYPFTYPKRTPLPSAVLRTLIDYRKDFIDKDKPTHTAVITYTAPERTTISEVLMPKRTTKFEFTVVPPFTMDAELVPTTKKLIEEIRSRQEELRKMADKEALYNMMFYNDDDTTSIKKEEPEGIDGEDDRKGSGDNMQESEDSASSPETTPPYENFTEEEFNPEMQNLIANNNSLVTNMTTHKSSSIFIDFVLLTTKNYGENLRDKRRPLCSLLKLRQLNFNSPRTLPEIVNQLKLWADDSPVAKWKDITYGNYTTMENPIYMVIVDDPSGGQISSAKQTVMIVAGIQGRDHHAVAAAMYVLYQLIERTEAHADLLTKYRFWIIPVFNPDGYDYSMTFPHRREWSKNLRQQWDVCQGRESCSLCESHGVRCTIQPCYGVNLDRNFEYQWIPASERNTEHPCGRLYAGPRQLSEIETRALTQFLADQNAPIGTFIAFKEGDVLGVMYPYSHTKKKRAMDQAYRQRASRAASAAYSIGNRPYIAGQTSEFLPLYAGGIEDWVDGHLGIDNTYTIMMFRPSESYDAKLMTERVVHEAYAAMDTLLIQSLEPLSPPPSVKLTRKGHCERTHPKRLLYIMAIYFLLLLNG